MKEFEKIELHEIGFCHAPLKTHVSLLDFTGISKLGLDYVSLTSSILPPVTLVLQKKADKLVWTTASWHRYSTLRWITNSRKL